MATVKFTEINKSPQYINDEPEGITFGGFDSRAFYLWLISRTAPSPQENEIVDSVPYMQGVYDFSMLDGERYFKNRELTYKFILVKDDYRDRVGLESHIKRLLMPQGIGELHDSHDPAYYWQAKCKSVEVEDDSKYGTLTVTIVFDAYPFAKLNHDEGTDYWDDVDFNAHVWQDVEFTLSNQTKSVVIENAGSHLTPATLIYTGTDKIKVKLTSAGGTEIEVNKDNSKALQVQLAVGRNTYDLTGTGTIKFSFRKEAML